MEPTGSPRHIVAVAYGHHGVHDRSVARYRTNWCVYPKTVEMIICGIYADWVAMLNQG